MPPFRPASVDIPVEQRFGKENILKLGVSEICYTLFRGKTDHLFAGKEMQLML